MNKLKIGIVGSRKRNTIRYKNSLLELLRVNDWLNSDKVMYISGGCYIGGDKFAEEIAHQYNINILIFYANWSKYGKGAGYKRNKLIANECDILIAIPNPDKDGGTEHTISLVRELDKDVYLIEG